MNRRKAIRNILLVGGGGMAVAGGFTWFRFYHKPDLSELDQYKALIEEMAETIIPETDTPGAKSAGVAGFVITMVRECTPVTGQNRFLYGLADVEAHAHSKYGKSYLQCSGPEKNAITAYFEKRDRPYPGIKGKVANRLIGPSFFNTLKKYTVIGYCTSMKGATIGMEYDYIPGVYKGCMSLHPGQKCWATS